MKIAIRQALLAASAIPLTAWVHPAIAQDTAVASPGAGRPAGPEQAVRAPEIVVTARKREETASRAPIVMQVVTAEQIENANIQSVEALAEVVPGLRIQRGIGGPVGAVAYVRGVGSGTSAQYIDQSVGFAVDEIGFSHGSFYDAAVFDLAQVELLKGPQGLFFGKSTTAGIISFTTANPTRAWETELRAGYEFNADEALLSGHVSGPLTDNLGIRVAGYYSSMQGWLRNPNPDTAPSSYRVPDAEDFGGRLTLEYAAPDGRFRSLFKLAATDLDSNGDQQSMRQFVTCSTGGSPQIGFFQYDNCKLDDTNIGTERFPAYDPSVDWLDSAGDIAAFQNGSPFPGTGDGGGFLKKKTVLSSLNLQYDLTDALTITSVLGYGNVDTDTQQQGVINSLGVYQLLNNWEEDNYSAELRLASDWGSLINFMAGGLYASGESHNVFAVSVPAITRWVEDTQVRETETQSVFGQLILTPSPQIEFTAGGRYTHIREEFPYLSALSNVVGFRPGDANDASGNQAPGLPESTTRYVEDNFSPEFTLTYRPNDDLTAFVSYKEGYKGPGYNATGFLITNYTENSISSFGGERVRGFEGGVKTWFLDRQLYASLAAYRYKYLDLQVSHYDATRGVITISNGADAVTRGLELTLAYTPDAVPGLLLNAYTAYNDAYYSDFTTSPCYGGQTAADGCSPAVPGGPVVQDLTGETLAFAPDWVGNLSADYTLSVSQRLEFGAGANFGFSSQYNYTPANHPQGVQDGWATIDANLRIGAADERWEVALIGRNLTDERYVTTGFDAGTVTPGVLSDTQGIANRSRQILLQLTVRQ